MDPFRTNSFLLPTHLDLELFSIFLISQVRILTLWEYEFEFYTYPLLRVWISHRGLNLFFSFMACTMNEIPCSFLG